MNIIRQHIYTHTIPIRWRDIDPYNVVNHSVFFTYLEEARWHWFYNLVLQKAIKCTTPIIDAHITFKKPLTYPGSVLIKIYSELPSTKSWTIYHEIFSEKNPDILCAEASVKFVCFDPVSNKVIPIPEELMSHIYPQQA